MIKTMKDIAKEAGVSVTTVSNVINGKTGRVSVKTQEKIQKLIEAYDYSPNMNAKALVNASSRLIGILYYSNSPDFDFSDPFVAELLSGISKVAKQNRYFTLLLSLNDVEDIKIIQSNWQFTGFLAVGFYQDIYINTIDIVSVPIVFIDTHLDEKSIAMAYKRKDVFFVRTDDWYQGRQAVNYLTSIGHNKIAFLSYQYNPQKISVIQQRIGGYRQGLEEHHIAYDNALEFTDQEFDLIAEKLNEFTAILVTADHLAMILIKYLRDRNLFDTQKLSIISFDDIKFAEVNNPPLTTVRLNQSTKGKIAMEQMIDFVTNDADIPKTTIIPGEIIERESTHRIN